jgi:dTDP-4-amino-4,6-dideoxygalactose transaminase
MIPVMKPSLPQAESLLNLLSEIDDNNIYSNYGPLSRRLQEEYSKYLDIAVDHIVPIVNATLAIQGALQILDQKEWVLPDYTFSATAHAALGANKSISLCDVDRRSMKMKVPDEFERRQYGALPVMPFGAPIIFEEWNGFNSLVIDAAASLGAPYPKFSTMPRDSMVVFSLHATKVLGAGEGALVICENASHAKKLRAWSNFGFDGSRISDIAGTNAKMSEYSCAVALSSILNFRTEKVQWENALELIRKAEFPGHLRTAVDGYMGFRPYWIIQTADSKKKIELSAYLSANGVESRSWWSSRISDMPAFSRLKKLHLTENAKFLAETQLGLPLWKGISENEISLISSHLSDFYSD